MKKFFVFMAVLLAATTSFSQGGWLRPNNSFGTISNRQSIDSAFLFPTGCGTPTSLKAYDLNKAALYFDSCNHRLYIYNPKLDLWGKASGDSLFGITDTLFSANRYINLNTKAFQFKGTGKIFFGNKDYSTADAKVIIRTDNYAQVALQIGDSITSTTPNANVNIFQIDSMTQAGMTSLKGASLNLYRKMVPKEQVLMNKFYNANTVTFDWNLAGDSIRRHSQGGDAEAALKAVTSYTKRDSYIGRSIVSNVAEGSIFQVVPSLIGKISLSGPAPNNWIRVRGWNASMASYLLVNPFDTIDKYIGHMSTGNIVGKVLKLVDYYATASGAPSADSAYAFVSPFMQSRNFFNGTMAIGGLADNTAGIFRPVNNSSILDVASTTKGVLIPRMSTTEQNNIVSPATGLLIYNTDSLSICHYNGVGWRSMQDISGTWIPTESSVTGGSVTDIQPFLYSRQGNIVSFSGYVGVEHTTGSSLMTFELSLPADHTSNFTTDYQCNGTIGMIVTGSGGFVSSEATGDKIKVSVYGGPTAGTGMDIRITGQYQIL